MNKRFEIFISRLQALITADREIASCPAFAERHAEQFGAAAFSYKNDFDYRKAAEQNIEQCRGYFVPDSLAIANRLEELRYPARFSARIVDYVRQAASNDPDVGLYTPLITSLPDKQFENSVRDESDDRISMRQTLAHDLEFDEGRVRKQIRDLFVRYGIPDAHEDDENFKHVLHLPLGFPSFQNLGKEINIPFEVYYDLDLGVDQEALFYRTNRQLAFRGNMRLCPSGRRSWAYPTVKLDENPFVDQRNETERRGEKPPRIGELLDDNDFNAGLDAAWENKSPPSTHQSFSWLAGYILNANGSMAWGHLSTGQADKAFYEALKTAKDMGLENAFELAAEGCRHIASRRCSALLEETIEHYLRDQ